MEFSDSTDDGPIPIDLVIYATNWNGNRPSASGIETSLVVIGAYILAFGLHWGFSNPTDGISTVPGLEFEWEVNAIPKLSNGLEIGIDGIA